MLEETEIYQKALENLYNAIKMRGNYSIEEDIVRTQSKKIPAMISGNTPISMYIGRDPYNYRLIAVMIPPSFTSYTQSKLEPLIKSALKECYEDYTKSIHLIVIANFKDRKTIFKVAAPSHNEIFFNEFMNVYHLSFNYMDHMYQPKYRVIREITEIDEILLKYNINSNQLATMNYSDPVNFYLGAIPKFPDFKKSTDDIVEIIRPDGIFYRKITWTI